MNELLFWWGPTSAIAHPPLWYVDRNGTAVQEDDPQHGLFSVSRLLADGYQEILWQTARAMGAPISGKRSKCDHDMRIDGSGTYCLKPDCDVNWI